MKRKGGTASRSRKAHNKTRRAARGLSALDIFHTPIYVINLKARKDRWNIFMNQDPIMKALDIHRVDATNGKALDVMKDPRISPNTRLNILRNDRRTHREIATMGAIGASISHIRIWRKIVASGVPYAVIMEDDARIERPMLEKINEVAKTIPDSARLWLFGLYKPTHIEEPIPRSKWSKVYHFTACHAYVITREAAKLFLSQALPIEMHIDHYMSIMSVIYDKPMMYHEDVYVPFGGIMEVGNKARALESNTSQHKKDGCSACHVPDHLSRYYRRVGPKTKKGRIVHGLIKNIPDRRVLTYKGTRKVAEKVVKAHNAHTGSNDTVDDLLQK